MPLNIEMRELRPEDAIDAALVPHPHEDGELYRTYWIPTGQ
jgi:hypothetical protein